VLVDQGNKATGEIPEVLAEGPLDVVEADDVRRRYPDPSGGFEHFFVPEAGDVVR